MIKAEFELWKDVKGFEGLYQVSTWGNVKSIKKNIILKPTKNTKGYFFVDLHKNGKRKLFLIHRLVAEAFILNPLNLPEVNHKDEVKTNNRRWNLEWCSSEYNKHYGTAIERMKKTLTNRKDCSKPVYKYDLQGNLIYKYMSMMSAERDGFVRGSIRYSISKNKPYKGYIWSYAEINQELQ